MQYGDRKVLDTVSTNIKVKDKIGLVGPNGAGKSTLLKIITSDAAPSEGTVLIPKDATIGHLRQVLTAEKGITILEAALKAFEEVKVLEGQLQELERYIEQATDYESDTYLEKLNHYSTLTEQLAVLDAGAAEGRAIKILKGLGFDEGRMGHYLETLSGGWLMRVELAKLLLRRPDYLFLDEPTNHLDIESIIWLEAFLRDYSGAYVVISHDRTFLNNISKAIMELRNGKIYRYTGNYDKFLLQREEHITIQQAAYENQLKEIERKEQLINRFRAKATKAKMAQSMMKQLDKMERLDAPEMDMKQMKLRFPPPPRSGELVVEVKGVKKSFGDNHVLRGVDLQIRRNEKVSFIGQNGRGKSTLVKIITGQYQADAGSTSLGYNVFPGYYAQDQADRLNPKLTVLQTMENEATEETRSKVRTILGSFLFSGEDVEKKVSVLSGGERARLSLALLTLRPSNLLILDEPTNHLDMNSMEVLREALQNYKGTMIVVSHDRAFLKGLTEKTYYFENRGIKEFLGDVNYFLDKSGMLNLRQASLSVMNTSDSKPKSKPKMDYNARRAIQNKIKSAERAIEKLEKAIEEIEDKMKDPGFYMSDDSDKLLKKYGQLKKDLDAQNRIWEEQVELLDEG